MPGGLFSCAQRNIVAGCSPRLYIGQVGVVTLRGPRAVSRIPDDVTRESSVPSIRAEHSPRQSEIIHPTRMAWSGRAVFALVLPKKKKKPCAFSTRRGRLPLAREHGRLSFPKRRVKRRNTRLRTPWEGLLLGMIKWPARLDSRRPIAWSLPRFPSVGEAPEGISGSRGVLVLPMHWR